MAKGKYGTPMSSIFYLKRANHIPCDCKKCNNSKYCADVLFCVKRNDIITEDKDCKTCKWYDGPNLATKKARKNKHKKSKNNER